MNYELAKKLKDAGFPFKDHIEYETVRGEKVEYPINVTNKDIIQSEFSTDFETKISKTTNYLAYNIPTLEELIEACGNKFGTLQLTILGWSALTSWTPPQVFSGSTPKEAVANLWLALNSK